MALVKCNCESQFAVVYRVKQIAWSAIGRFIMASEISTDSLEELVACAKASEPAGKQAYVQFQAARQQYWEQLAGSAAKLMQSNLETARSFLLDANPKRRLAALDILARQWKPDAELLAAAEKIAFYDQDSDVRTVALLVVGDCCSGTKDRRITRLLAEVALDTGRDEKFRKAAYLGLFKVCLPIQAWPDLASFRFPEDVDWDFVRNLTQSQS
jgi:hypothetical protein